MADQDINTRVCTRCETDKPFSEFNKKKGGKHGLQPVCRDCQKVNHKAWREANPEKRKEDMRRWYVANRDTVLKRQREAYPSIRDAVNSKRRDDYRDDPSIREGVYAWREQNMDKFRGHCRQYYRANAEAVKLRSKTWRSKNGPIVRAMQRSWGERNKDLKRSIQRAASSRRRARKNMADGSYSHRDVELLLKAQKWKCACCRQSVKRRYHVDHVMPLALGGSNHPHNLQILCPDCNLRKSAKHPIDFMQQRGFLL